MYTTKEQYAKETGKCCFCDKLVEHCICEIRRQVFMDKLVNEFKQDFSGNESYLSGVNDGMYHILRKLFERNYL